MVQLTYAYETKTLSRPAFQIMDFLWWESTNDTRD